MKFLFSFFFLIFKSFRSINANLDGSRSHISLLPDENSPLGWCNEIKYSYVFNGLDKQIKHSIALR